MQDLAQRASKDHPGPFEKDPQKWRIKGRASDYTRLDSLRNPTKFLLSLFALPLKWDSTLMADVCLYPKKGWDGVEGTL